MVFLMYPCLHAYIDTRLLTFTVEGRLPARAWCSLTNTWLMSTVGTSRRESWRTITLSMGTPDDAVTGHLRSNEKAWEKARQLLRPIMTPYAEIRRNIHIIDVETPNKNDNGHIMASHQSLPLSPSPRHWFSLFLLTDTFTFLTSTHTL
jgi:hypothetical protein